MNRLFQAIPARYVQHSGIGVVAPPVQLVPEAFHSPNSARALCSIRRRDYARCFTCKSCKRVYAYPLFPNRQNVVALLFTCKSCKIVQAHPFFPNRNRGYARLLACKSCKLVQACRFSRDGKRGMPASLHAGLANLCRRTPFLPKRGGGTPFYLHASLTNWCRHTPCFLKKEIEVCPFIYMQLLKRHTPLSPKREERYTNLFTCKSSKFTQPYVSSGTCVSFTCRSCKWMQTYPFVPEEGERHRSAYFISNSCTSMSTYVFFQKVGFICSVHVQIL